MEMPRITIQIITIVLFTQLLVKKYVLVLVSTLINFYFKKIKSHVLFTVSRFILDS